MRSLASRRGSLKRRVCRFARGTKAVLPRAVRPLAASAPLLVREALAGLARSHTVPPVAPRVRIVVVSIEQPRGRR